MEIELNIDVHYWNKETNYLFDFNYNDIEINNIKTKQSGHVVRTNNDITFINKKAYNQLKNKLWTSLWEIVFLKDEVTLMLPDTQQDKTFLTIKHTFKPALPEDNNGYKIKIGDQFKFGKMILQCKELKLSNENNNTKAKEKTIADNCFDDNNDNGVNSSGNQLILRQNRTKPKKQNACRICLSDDSDNDNPLITPCKCSGTMRHIHIECLRDWLKSKITIKTYVHMISYTYKTLECELCLSKFPLKIKTKHNEFDTINMSTPNSAYLIFEQIGKEDQDKTLFLVMFKDKTTLKIGRSNDSDVRLSDISISRHHANLHISKNDFYIEDNDAKFGTLILLDSSLSFILQKPVGLQIGKHFIIMEIKKTFIAMLCCNK